MDPEKKPNGLWAIAFKERSNQLKELGYKEETERALFCLDVPDKKFYSEVNYKLIKELIPSDWSNLFMLLKRTMRDHGVDHMELKLRDAKILLGLALNSIKHSNEKRQNNVKKNLGWPCPDCTDCRHFPCDISNDMNLIKLLKDFLYA